MTGPLRPAVLEMKTVGFAPREAPPGMLCLGLRKDLRSLSKLSRAEAVRRRGKVLALGRAEVDYVARMSVIAC
jgi:hypothetical protein